MIIDVHSHFAHPKVAKRAPVPPSLLDVERLIGVKQEAGIGLTIVSSPNGPGTLVLDSRSGLRELPLGAEEQQAGLSGNAQRLFGIEDRAKDTQTSHFHPVEETC